MPTVDTFGMVYALAYRCFKICSDWTNFHEKLSFLKKVFKRTGTLFHFLITVFKHSLIRYHKTSSVNSSWEENLVFGEISLQTRMKLRKFLKGLQNSCKLQVFKSERKLSNVFPFKDCLLTFRFSVWSSI